MIMLFIFLHIYFVYVDFVSLKGKKSSESSHSDQGQLSLYVHLVSFHEETVFWSFALVVEI